MLKLAPSILSADFACLLEDIQKIAQGGADYIHVDVMDGHFVPNISFGAPVMNALNGKTSLPYDVHLMIEAPDQYIDSFVTPQTAYITVHQEACVHLHRTIQNIHAKGVKAGVAINPATPVSTLSCILEDVDLVLVMSVNPGFGGQKFIPAALDKVRELAELKREWRSRLQALPFLGRRTYHSAFLISRRSDRKRRWRGENDDSCFASMANKKYTEFLWKNTSVLYFCIEICTKTRYNITLE